MNIIEYKCPNCDAPIKFDEKIQKLRCDYCDGIFSSDDVLLHESRDTGLYNEESVSEHEFAGNAYAGDFPRNASVFMCSACGGSIVGTDVSAALFCPYCGNPAIVESSLSGEFRPDYIIPFKCGRENAKEAYSKFCSGKPLLPGKFKEQSTIEKITGIYVPYRIMDCNAYARAEYSAKNIKTWCDRRYRYVKTDNYELERAGSMDFLNVPADASRAVDDAFMESIEPFDYCDMCNFNMSYLSGYFADKYDVPFEECRQRINERVKAAMSRELKATTASYDETKEKSIKSNVICRKSAYALFPVWLFRTKFNNEYYYFAMNGQSGRYAGKLPVSNGKLLLFSGGIALAVLMLVSLLFTPIIGVPAGAIAAVISFVLLPRGMCTAKPKNDALDYKAGKLVISDKRDSFLYSNTVKLSRGAGKK